jgi:hypothetical protein
MEILPVESGRTGFPDVLDTQWFENDAGAGYRRYQLS